MLNQISEAPLKTKEIEHHLKKAHHEVKNFVDALSFATNINETSTQLEVIKNELNEMSEINEARILYFKTEIALGNYQIDNDKIAMKMLNFELA